MGLFFIRITEREKHCPIKEKEEISYYRWAARKSYPAWGRGGTLII